MDIYIDRVYTRFTGHSSSTPSRHLAVTLVGLSLIIVDVILSVEKKFAHMKCQSTFMVISCFGNLGSS